MIDNILMLKSHIEVIIPKLSVVWFAATAITHFFVRLDTLKMVYHSYFHSIINYGIIFWGNSSYSNNIFKFKKGTIRNVMGIGIRDLCRDFF
jgi:hypothetical protein